MMRVSNATWRKPADAEATARRYASCGYIVAIVEHRSERAGSFIELQCEYRP